MVKKKETPILVKVISVVCYIAAAFFGGFLFMAFFLLSMIGGSPDLLIILFTLIPALLFILIGVNLWKGENWARITLIIISIIIFISSLIFIFIGFYSYPDEFTGSEGLLFGLSFLIPSVLIPPYLLFNKKVKKAFT